MAALLIVVAWSRFLLPVYCLDDSPRHTFPENDAGTDGGRRSHRKAHSDFKIGPQRYQVAPDDQTPNRWQTASRGHCHPHHPLQPRLESQGTLRLPLSGLRWFGRPEKYSAGTTKSGCTLNGALTGRS